MLILVQIDLSAADVSKFDAYEAQALALLAGYGARLLERVRSTDGWQEIHLIEFPDIAALNAFRMDPVRISLQGLWDQCGARSVLTEVTRAG
ncbi:MAG: hypothetical protein QM688_08715 [Sphingomonas bacterium]